MTVEILFLTQIASIIAYVGSVFFLYRLLVSQKDAVIEALKAKNDMLDERIKQLEAQTPDALVHALSSRVEITKKEIEALSEDGVKHSKQIQEKERDLDKLRNEVRTLSHLLKETELVCPYCQSLLTRREWHTLHGEIDGREVEADIEYIEYACGYATNDDGGGPVRACQGVHDEP